MNILQADEKDRIVERKDVPLFENDAFREAVINAFVHNKWVTENEPMITVFSDRIEILSRGILPPEKTLEGFFRGESVPVNKKLSEIRNNPNITKPQIAQLVGVGKTAVDNAIAVLKQKGYIKRSGSNKTGFWEILNAEESNNQ